ncbi:hypothetical protein [Pseudaminobacter soli (ex Li et al. 2025)]|uniref:DNA-binding protein n=1 Tax=Pseudaminobacter soli (ex Li et al. 2025) TaxID=1295366 RepID=A0A2P7S4I4_9HYPH|nr:hypothetical protein [Mesorhizobium soli]PSJ57388.1 hypothetical protein C7I85_22655 [Mesorhizobium soli]
MSDQLAILNETIASARAHLVQVEVHVAQLEAQRAALAGPPYTRPSSEAVQPREETDLIELHIAAQRFGMASDTLRFWCRTYKIGVKRGGRWWVSIRKMQARLRP